MRARAATLQACTWTAAGMTRRPSLHVPVCTCLQEDWQHSVNSIVSRINTQFQASLAKLKIAGEIKLRANIEVSAGAPPTNQAAACGPLLLTHHPPLRQPPRPPRRMCRTCAKPTSR